MGRKASAISAPVVGSDTRHDHYWVCFLAGSAGEGHAWAVVSSSGLPGSKRQGLLERVQQRL